MDLDHLWLNNLELTQYVLREVRIYLDVCYAENI